MKKAVSLLLALALAAALCACGKIEKENINKDFQSAVTSYETSMDFRDSSGELVSRLVLSLPELGENAAYDGARIVNAYFKRYESERISEMESNIENTSAYLKKYGLEGPRIIEITYEVYYESPTLLSVILKTRAGTNLDESAVSVQPLTFSIVYGNLMNVKDFALEKRTDDYRAQMIGGVFKAADKTYSPNGVPLSAEKKNLLLEAFNEENFLVDEGKYVFVYSFEYLSDGSRSGDYYCEVPVEYIQDYFIDPADYEG